MYKSLEDVQAALSTGLGMNNLSRQMFQQFKTLNSLPQYEIGDLKPQAVVVNDLDKGFTVVPNFVQHIAEGKRFSMRQDYSYDAFLIGCLTTGLVFELHCNFSPTGKLSRRSASDAVAARNTTIPVRENIQHLVKTNYLIYPQ